MQRIIVIGVTAREWFHSCPPLRGAVLAPHAAISTMLTLRTHVMIAVGIFAAIVLFAIIGNALQGSGVIEGSPALRLASMILFFGLGVALMFSAVPVMVSLGLGFQAGIGNAAQPAITRLLARERTIIFVLWALLALGLVVALPAAITDGAFE